MLINEETIISKKPTGNRFSQQKLKGWTPSFDARHISRFYVGSSIIYLLIGIIIYIVNEGIMDLYFDYTYCENKNGLTCATVLQNYTRNNLLYQCECVYSFTINQYFKSPIYFYYILGNFYQNHRHYRKSRDDKQLHGEDNIYLSHECEPQRYFDKYQLIRYNPCGLVANSLFNDTFELHYDFKNETIPVVWTNKEIAWSIDTNSKFGRPKFWNKTKKPENWKLTALERNQNAYTGDEEFLVWMRPAPFPNFKKLHRIIISRDEPFNLGLPEGNYTLLIKYAYPVIEFQGSKSIYFSTTSFIGGKNIGLPLMFLSLSGIQFILGVILMYLEKYSDDKIDYYRIESLT